MQDHEQHVSDEELLLATDGETRVLAQRAQSHLQACARCRTRAAELESVLIDLARAERSSPDAELPPAAGARAMLRLRMAELSTGRPSFFSWGHISGGFLTGALGAATLAAVIVLAGVMAIRHFTTAGAPLLLSLEHGELPNHVFTPGAARHASLAEVCTLSHEEVVKDVSPGERQKVFAEYGIPSAQSDRYEVDYLITPGLGGDDDIRNLWPEPYNAEMWNARKKDVLEERLHEMVCSHRLDLSVAQEAIASNWIAAYEKYVPATLPQDPDAKLSLQRRS
jgi:anti-sigma factor RsiW